MNLTELRTALALALVLTPGSLAAQTDAAETAKRTVGLVGTNPVHWRVTFHEDPAHAAIFSWSTAEPGSAHTVHYDTEPRGAKPEEYRFVQPTTRNGRFTKGSESLKDLAIYYHHAEVRNLQPSTKYYFVVQSDGEVSRELHFITGPADNREFQLIFGGDSRSDLADRQRVNRFIEQVVRNNPRVFAMVHGGDYVNNGNNVVQWAAWLTHQQSTITPAGQVLPVIPVRGNHEGRHPQFDEAFCWPGGGTNYYTCKIGNETSLVVLNTDGVMAGKQRKFLNKTLTANKKTSRWLLATYHRPAFPAVKEPSHALQHFVPLFDKHLVDLVLEADGHVIKRTLPIRYNRHDPNGVVYVGEGGLGVKQRDPASGRWYLDPPGMIGKGHHIYLVTVNPTALRTRTLSVENGKVLDAWERKPRKR